MVPAGNKAKRLSSVSHTTKTIHQFINSIHDLTRPHDQRVMRLYGQESVNVNYHFVKLDGNKRRYLIDGSEDIIILVCHVIL